MYKKIKNNNGFSIIEASIVLAVVSIGLLGVFSLVTQNITVQRVNRNMLVASMLAQEGIELVRSVRDNNWLDATALWDEDIAGYAGNDFIIDNTEILGDITITDVNGINNAKLYLQAGTNFYTHDSGGGNTPTPYSRLITVTPDPNAPVDYYIIKSDVQWLENGVPKDYVAETYLYNWR